MSGMRLRKDMTRASLCSKGTAVTRTGSSFSHSCASPPALNPSMTAWGTFADRSIATMDPSGCMRMVAGLMAGKTILSPPFVPAPQSSAGAVVKLRTSKFFDSRW